MFSKVFLFHFFTFSVKFVYGVNYASLIFPRFVNYITEGRVRCPYLFNSKDIVVSMDVFLKIQPNRTMVRVSCNKILNTSVLMRLIHSGLARYRSSLFIIMVLHFFLLFVQVYLGPLNPKSNILQWFKVQTIWKVVITNRQPSKLFY